MSEETDLKELAEIRAWLQEKLDSLQEELERTRRMLLIVDKQLGEKSFVKAITVAQEPRAKQTEPPSLIEAVEERQLKRLNDGYLLGTALISKDEVTIQIAPDVVLRSTTSPFKSYFLGKILGGMKGEDERLVNEGKLGREAILDFSVDEAGGRIRSVRVRGFRDKVRLNEILSTATWTFTKMLEKQS